MKTTSPTADSPMHVRCSRLLTSLVLISALLCGCINVPTQEMSDARQAISSARSADAASYAPRSMSNAERLLANAEKSLKQGRYDLARDDALEARQSAMKAREVAVAITEARAAAQQAKAKGAASALVEGLIDEAQTAGREGDESRAWELATEAKRRLQ